MKLHYIQNPYVRFSLLLFFSILFISSFLWSTGCSGCGDPDVYYYYSAIATKLIGAKTPFMGYLERETTTRYARPKSEAARTIGLLQTGSGATKPDKVTYTWTPPKGATFIHVDGHTVSGDPPYVLKDRDPDEVIDIEYKMPDIPEHREEHTAVETLQTEYTDENGQPQSTAVRMETRITRIDNQAVVSAPPAPDPSAQSGQIAAQSIEMWDVNHYIDIKGITLTTELCEDWLDVVAGDEYFVAVRVPEPPTTTVPLTQAVELPFVFGGAYSQTVKLESYSPYTIPLTMTVEYRPDRFDFVANELPAAEDEYWIPLGLKADDAITCPDGLNVPPNGWGLVYDGLLDLSYAPDSCEGCMLPIYYCYEGQDAPEVAASGEDENIRESGITCLGPQPFRLKGYSSSDFALSGGSVKQFTPPITATFHHDIAGPSGETANITYTSSLSDSWQMYGGDFNQPDYTKPLTPPLTLPAFTPIHFWMVYKNMPTDTVTGTHTLWITASLVSTPTEKRWAADTLWVGDDWIAPPEAASDQADLYLPVILKP